MSEAKVAPAWSLTHRVFAGPRAGLASRRPRCAAVHRTSRGRRRRGRDRARRPSGVAPSGTPCGGPAPQPSCVTRVTTSEPGRLLLTGSPVPGALGDIEHLDTPSLRGIRRTAPYFSNNTAATLEDVVDHYKQFFKRVAINVPAAPLLTTQPGVVPPVQDRPFTDAEVPALLAYLRKI